MRNALDDLLRLVLPPPHPKQASGKWEPYEAELGIRFPADFKDLIAAYGNGWWGNFLNPVIPYLWPDPKEYRKWLDTYLEPERESRANCPGEYDGPIFPEAGGRLPWAMSGNGDVLWWQTMGSPEEWTIIAWESRSPEHEYFEVSTTEFMHGWLTGTIQVSVMTDYFLKQAGPVFQSC